ncbi:hypothetical protein H10PHJ05_44 [Aeromonas phage HJ05]|nr:hypothetical protein H10PHJ05_44 [Aeromonas phage HJ05]
MTEIVDDLRTAKMLPGSSSGLEQHLTTYFDTTGEVVPAVDKLRTAKHKDIPDSFVPWLVYEYGLEEVLPWVTDPREAMRTGVQWQRIRGTQASLELALSWVQFTAKHIEQEPPGRHFFEYQIGLEGVPIGDELITNIYQLAKLSAPIRSRLTRIFNDEYDVRHFILDYSMWGDLLSGYSGVDWGDDLQLSFGRVTKMVEAIRELQPVAKVHTRCVDMSLVYRTGFVLDYSDWGAVPILENSFQHFRLVSPSTNEGLSVQQRDHIRYTFSKSGMVLDDGFELGTPHTMLSGFYYWREVGEGFTLDDTRLDEQVQRMELVQVDEVFDNAYTFSASYSRQEDGGGFAHQRTRGVDVRHYPLWPVLDETAPVQSASQFTISRVLTGTARYKGQFWTGVYWPKNESWNSINVITGDFKHVSSS